MQKEQLTQKALEGQVWLDEHTTFLEFYCISHKQEYPKYKNRDTLMYILLYLKNKYAPMEDKYYIFEI